MPRYFFNITYGEESYHDQIGEILSNDFAAWQEATASAGQSLRDLDGKLRPGTTWRMEVGDTRGSIIFSIEVRARKAIA